MLGASEEPDLNARGAVRKSPKFLLLLSAPASGGVLAEAGGTCKGSPLHSDRRRGAYGDLDRPLPPLTAAKSHEAGTLNKRNLGLGALARGRHSAPCGRHQEH